MTNDQYMILVQELQTDPLGRGYAAMTAEEVSAALNAQDRLLPGGTFCTMRAVLEKVPDAGPLIATLDAIAATDPVIAEGLRALRTYATDGGLDFSSPVVIALVDQLYAAGVVRADQREALLALGKRPASRAEELGLPQVYPGHVASARQMMKG